VSHALQNTSKRPSPGGHESVRPEEAVSVDLTVVVPAYNEQEVLAEFHNRLAAVLDEMCCHAEIVYVNDGSRDNTLSVIEKLQGADPRVAIVDLSRNFGKEIALTAGLDYSRGDAVIVIDADLQDPPELIPQLVAQWENGFDVVYAKRLSRDGESGFKKLTAFGFYRTLNLISRVKVPEDTGDYRLLSRRAVNAIKELREQHRFMKGLFAWIGYRQTAVPYRRDARFAGTTKWNYWKLWNFAIEGITSFTIGPLKVATYIGIVTALAAFIYALVIIAKTILFGDPVAGYPSLMVVILFLGGVQLVTIGIMGEYIGRMFDESKSRPLYFINDYSPSHHVQVASKKML
jgi:polyisoprenyl-phosphate glycosyltransferase